ncbi:MAG: IS982 family transposase [Thermoleophilaceae bacterium]
MTADLDTLLTALYVLADDLLPRRRRARRRPKITDAELVCLAVAQILLDCPSERRFLRFAMVRLGHLFPYLPKQPGYNKRMRALAPQIVLVLNTVARVSPSWCDNVRLLDSTPVPCGQSREAVKRSDFAGHAAYGYCASHSRHFWGFRLYLLCASDGMPIAFELAPANLGERRVAAEMLARVDLEGYTVIADKGFAGEDFERLMTELRAIFLRPDRKGEKPRFGGLGGVRQWIESTIDTIKGQLSLERHGAHTMDGLIVRVAGRLLALAAGIWHNWNTGDPGRHLIAYDH